MTGIELAATIFGFICVFLTIRKNIWCWPTGLVQVVLYLIIFFQAKLYSDAILHVVYIFLQLYGWHHWLRGGDNHSTLPVTKIQNPGLLLWTIGGIAGTALWGFLMHKGTDASFPYGDAFTTVFSLIAQWLLAKKKLESWLFWIVVDVVAIVIYYYKGLYLTTGLYSLFLIMATIGFFNWRKEFTRDKSDLLIPVGEEL